MSKKHCKFSGCSRPIQARGLCFTHYTQKVKGFKLTKIRHRTIKTKICTYPTCTERHYAKSLCRSHYNHFLRTGKIEDVRHFYQTKKCDIPGCGKICVSLGYCRLHYERFKRQGDPLKVIISGSKGEHNGRWHGGVSQYKDHYLMKQNRLKKLKKTKNCCEICGKKRRKSKLHIHHINKNKNDHRLRNLMVVCPKDHSAIHRGVLVAHY